VLFIHGNLRLLLRQQCFSKFTELEASARYSAPLEHMCYWILMLSNTSLDHLLFVKRRDLPISHLTKSSSQSDGGSIIVLEAPSVF